VRLSRQLVLRALTGSPILSKQEGLQTINGWPSWLPDIRLELRPECGFYTPWEIEQIRILLTLLSSLRSIILSPVLDVTPIVTPYGGAVAGLSPAFVNSILRDMGVRRVPVEDVYWTDFHFTVKAGPLGRAFLSSVRELPAILANYRSLLRVVGGPRLAQRLDTLDGKNQAGEPFFPKTPGVDFPSLGKLAIFGDKEGKTRIVAIVDYWTQTALKPLHNVLMKTLRKLPRHCTFNQSGFLSLLSLPGPFYSFDLTGATDRMPL